MKKLKYIEFTGSACLDTGLYCDRYTEVEARFIPVATTYTYWDCFFGAQNRDDGPDTFQLRRYDRGQNWIPRIQNYQPSGTGFPSIVNGQEYHVIQNEEMLMVNDVQLCPMSPTTNNRTTNTLYMGATHTGTQIYRPYNSKWIEFIVREGGVEVGHFVPVLDDNDEPAFYDSISGNYFYKTGTGTWTAGPIDTTLLIDPEELAFDSTGGSQTISVTSNTAWHVDTNDVPSWLTLSPLSGVDGDTITATTSWIMSSNVPDRSASITISNEEDDAELSLSQKGTGTLFFPDKIMYNDNGVWKTYYVARNVMKMYYNDSEVFRRVTFTPSLSLSTNSLTFPKTGSTDTVGVSANAPWSVSTSASWLTITTASTGFSVTAADYSSGETERQTTIIVTASNGDLGMQSVVSVKQKIGGLPDIPFMFNYNAKEYDSETGTFPKTEGQLFDQDIVLGGTPGSYVGPDYVKFDYGTYYDYTWSSTNDNPFNRNANNKNSFTFIYKTSGFTSGSENLFANRGANYNYMVRGNMLHTYQSGYLYLTPNADPQICVIRISADGTECVRKFVDAQGNTLQSVSANSISWGYSNNSIAFFAGASGGGELFYNDFYWMYCSLETLTDEEIQAVIDYNENL